MRHPFDIWNFSVSQAIHEYVVLLIIAVGFTLFYQLLVHLLLFDVFVDGVAMCSEVPELFDLDVLLFLLLEELSAL